MALRMFDETAANMAMAALPEIHHRRVWQLGAAAGTAM